MGDRGSCTSKSRVGGYGAGLEENGIIGDGTARSGNEKTGAEMRDTGRCAAKASGTERCAAGDSAAASRQAFQ